MTATARTACLALLTFALAGIGCGEQVENHSNTGPETGANAPTPATEPPATPGNTAPAAATTPDASASPASSTPATSKDQPGPAAEAAPAPEAAPDKDKSAAQDDGGVTLEKVSYETFLQRLAANPSKAKYTLVDAWASWCGPCKENFPHLLEMYQRYGPKGLAVATVSFDDPAESKQVADAKAFLVEKKAPFPNYLIDGEPTVGFDKFGINSIPAVFVYGPDGKEVKRFTMDDPNNQFTYDEVEKEVVALLEGKAGPGK